MKKVAWILIILLFISIASIVIQRLVIQKQASRPSPLKQVESKTNIDIAHKESIPGFPSPNATIDKQSEMVTNSDSILVLINKQRRLAENYEPQDLVKPNVRASQSGKNAHINMRKEAATALEQLFQAGEDDKIELFAVSAYRSYQYQEEVYTNNVVRLGQAEAAVYSAVPGYSEHQTGLSVDVSAQSVKFQLNTSFGASKEGKWLQEHAHEYGFIIRYLEGKTNITGYAYEPWHIRYVGIEPATYIYKNKLTLEEAMHADPVSSDKIHSHK